MGLLVVVTCFRSFGLIGFVKTNNTSILMSPRKKKEPIGDLDPVGGGGEEKGILQKTSLGFKIGIRKQLCVSW